MRYIYVLVIIGAFCTSSSFAQVQEIIASTGGGDTTGSKYYSYTIGDLVVQSGMKDSLYLASGFQQSDVIVSLQVAIKDVKSEAKIYPNPSADHFYLELKSKTLPNYSVVLHTNKGEFVFQKYFKNDKVKISTMGLAAGVYYLTVINEKGELLNQFKVLKAK